MSSSPPTPPDPPAAPAVARRLRLRPRTWRGWLTLFFAVVVVILGGTWLLTRMEPPWYEPLDPADLRTIDLSDRAQALLLDLHNKIQRVPRGEQTWTITQDELNSYIAIQFARAMDASGEAAPVISGSMVIFEPGQVTVCARTTRLPSPNKAGGVATVVFDVRMVTGADGKPRGFVKLASVYAGALPVPRSVVESRLQAFVPAISAAMQEALQAQFNLRESEQLGNRQWAMTKASPAAKTSPCSSLSPPGTPGSPAPCDPP